MIYYYDGKVTGTLDPDVYDIDCFEREIGKVIEVQLHQAQMLVEFSKQDLLYMLSLIEDK